MASSTYPDARSESSPGPTGKSQTMSSGRIMFNLRNFNNHDSLYGFQIWLNYAYILYIYIYYIINCNLSEYWRDLINPSICVCDVFCHHGTNIDTNLSNLRQINPTLPENDSLENPSRWFQHVSTYLKNMCQNGNLPQVGVKLKNIWVATT